MEKKLNKLIGLKKNEFDSFVEFGEIKLREAHLIPVFKPGDEMALTSVILSSMRLIKEFRKTLLSDARIMTGGKIYVYTEVVFSQFPDARVDGLLIVVKGGVIRDAAIFEMKNGSSVLEEEQIERYIQIARTHAIPRLITVSNQFVSEPTQFPIHLKTPKSVSLIHFSWSYLLTISHLLLFNNESNIEDQDQVEIMREVVNYLEFDKSGVCGFHQMKKGWTTVVDKINAGTRLRASEPDTHDAVISWQQEEKDLALILSRILGVFVNSGELKYRGKLKLRQEDDTKELINNHRLYSVLNVKGAVSDIRITALFDKRAIEMFVSLKPPQSKTLRGQLGWLKRQIDNCEKKGDASFSKLKNELLIEIALKNSRTAERVNLTNFEAILNDIRGREIREFKVLIVRDFGKKFASRTKFVEMLESVSIDFYKGIIQYLTKWEPSAPRITETVAPSTVDVESAATSENNSKSSDDDLVEKEDTETASTDEVSAELTPEPPQTFGNP